ncbi:UPF0187 protein [Smittium mucronatum]|uniref:UPF0187 protein n=1 Tax=Smittium mucronatum TaxID=133383 RepID=A0A1R0H307_9FUNG|nr:UPF0187 protein [Smittium mucronatum]
MVVFRTNTAYDRFWEGRKLFSSLEADITKVMRMMQVSIHPKSEKEMEEKIQAMKNVVAMAYSIKYYLLANPNYFNEKMKELLASKILALSHKKGTDNSYGENIDETSDKKMRSIEIFTKDTFNLPITISFEITKYLEYLDKTGMVVPVYMTMYGLIGSIVDIFVGCIRIETTPVPKAYSSHLYLITALYLCCVPFAMNGNPVAVTAVVQIILTFMLLGILSISEEIENPFGSDRNDLPISKYCDNMYDHLMFTIEHSRKESFSTV